MGALPQLSVVAGPHRRHERRLIHRLFEQNVAAMGAATDATALIVHDPRVGATDAHLSYADLNTTANRLARTMLAHLRAQPVAAVGPNADGDWIVAVCMPPSAELVAVLLACWKLGAAYLPLEASFPRQRIEHIMGEARPVLAIIDAAAADSFDASRCLEFGALQSCAAAVSDGSDLSEAETLHSSATNGLRIEEVVDDDDDDDRIAIVLYTSGSTGVPKGVRLPHAIVHNRLRWQFDVFPFSPSERTAVFKTALTFVDSVAEIWAPLLSGLAVLVVPKSVVRDPERLVDVLEAYRIERLVLVPTLLRTLLMYLPLRGSEPGLADLHVWVCSGETLTGQLVREFYAYFGCGERRPAVLCNFYGSTEIMGDVTYYVCPNGGGPPATDDMAALAAQTVPIGYPISNTMVYVLDGEMRPVKLGDSGELYVAGRNLAAGYVGGRDKFRFVVNPLSDDPEYDRLYRTGDYASVHADGALSYDGRTDSQIKIRGHRVDLAEVERQLLLPPVTASDDLLLPAIDKGLVLCYRAGEVDQALVAFVQLRHSDHCSASNDGSDDVSAAQIEAALFTRLADYMRPQVFVVDAIPLLVNGKVDRQSLLQRYAATASSPPPANNGHAGSESMATMFDYTGVRPQQADMARDLFETIGAAIGVGCSAARRVISLSANFYQLGGNSLNSIYTVTQLRTMGYQIGIQEFIAAGTLGDILQMMTDGGTTKKELEVEAEVNVGGNVDPNNNNEVLRFDVMPLSRDHRRDVIDMMTLSFCEKADLERLLKPNIVYQDYADIFEDMYEDVCRQGLSFVVYDRQLERIVGAALNTDAHCEPAVQIRSQLRVVFEFLGELQQTVRQAHATTATGQLFHAGMMGTSAQLTAQENIAAMHCMETEVLRVALAKGYSGVFTTNTSPLTQQLASHVHGYKTVRSAQVNQWQTADGWRPFAEAPDGQTALVQWKRLG